MEYTRFECKDCGYVFEPSTVVLAPTAVNNPPGQIFPVECPSCSKELTRDDVNVVIVDAG